MHQLQRRGRGAGGRELLADVVFDRLDVVVDARLDRLDAFAAALVRRLGERLRARRAPRR